MIQTADDFARSDTFDSRDVIETIESLEGTVTEYKEGGADEVGCVNCGDSEESHIPDEDDPAILWCGSNDDDDRTDLKVLRKFAEYAQGYVSDWKYGEQFIADSYFEQYTEQYADDIGAINDGSRLGGGSTPWPLMHIDWKAAAEDLQQDYTEFELLGNTFWAR